MNSHRFLSAVIFLMLSGWNSFTFAEGIGSKLSRAVGLSSAMKMKWNAKPIEAHGYIRMEGMQYLTDVPGEPQLSNSYFLSTRMKGYQETSWLDFAGDFSAGTFFTKGLSNFIVSEAYIATKGENFKIYLGRKKMPWSQADSRWDLGLIQSRYAIDLLRPEEQGLVGLFADYNSRYLRVSGMVTSIFIPHMGNEYREENGSLKTDSRWYRPPSSNYEFNNNINQIVYNLDVPDYLDLVQQPGAIVMARVGDKEYGPWASVSGGYLPASELALKRQNFKAAADERVDATVAPVVLHHEVRAADIGYNFKKDVSIGVSYISEKPKNLLPEPEWSIQNFEAIEAYAAFIEVDLKDFIISSLNVQLQYLKARGGGIVDVVASGAPDDFTIFDERMKFKDALSLEVRGHLTSFIKKPIMSKFKYLYDYEQQGSITSLEFLYFPSKKWAVVIGGDVLGVKDDQYAPSSFINQYRANDRYYGGATYVF